MSSELIQKTQKALLPPGSLWQVEEDGDLDQLLKGTADNWEDVRAFLETVGFVRDPLKTNLLEELEREFGIVPDFDLTEAERREQLAALKFDSVDGVGSDDDLQNLLQAAGFDVQVHRNDPPVDPALFVPPGELLLKGDVFLIEPGTAAQCGGETTVCGNVEAVCGFFRGSSRTEVTPDLPTDPDTFPFFFFVGGDATRDGGGFLTSILPATVPLHRRDRFRSFILEIKPWFTWAVLIINFT